MANSVEQLLAEIKEKEAAEKAAHDAEIEKVKAHYTAVQHKLDLPRRQAEQKAKLEKQKEAEQAEKELEAEARRTFFTGTPSASEELYLTVRGRLREEILLSRAREAEGRLKEGWKHSVYKI
jgi:hypothetical protein